MTFVAIGALISLHFAFTIFPVYLKNIHLQRDYLIMFHCVEYHQVINMRKYLLLEGDVLCNTKCLDAVIQVSKGAKIRNRYNQVPHLTQDTNGKVINLQLDTTNESQEVNPFPAGDHKAHINRRIQRHSKHKTEQKRKRSTKEVPPWNGH